MEAERTWLDDRSWVDVVAGSVPDADAAFDWLRDTVRWQQGRVFRYERWVDEPRLGGSLPADQPLLPAIADTHRLLQRHYRVPFARPTLVYYRSGRDLMAFHRDRDMRWLDDTLVALLVLGARRPFHLRPRDGRYRHEAEHKGATHSFAVGEGDLLVMGGACQDGWEHAVPPAPGVTDGRISVQWRWTSRRGKPAIGASYRAPRTYSR
ncbi:MAG: alpha-ketoglutarate-dependent dioxygenase AlkB [Acidimicrobiales bacterium]